MVQQCVFIHNCVIKSKWIHSKQKLAREAEAEAEAKAEEKKFIWMVNGRYLLIEEKNLRLFLVLDQITSTTAVQFQIQFAH